MPTDRLSVFISSRMNGELDPERAAVAQALTEILASGWMWETDADARSVSIYETEMTEVERCDLYLGLFWLTPGPGTIEEYDRAVTANKPRLIYEKHVDVARRDPALTTFLAGIPAKSTPARFTTTNELADLVKRGVMRVLVDTFRAKQVSPAPIAAPPATTHISATNSIIVTGGSVRDITQNN